MIYSDTILQLLRRDPIPVPTLTAFIALLRFNYHVMRATEPLLEMAADIALGERLEGDVPLGKYYAKHAEEEHGHARWMKEDIEELGGDVQIADHGAACIAGAQYYYLKHLGAVPFLGYIAALEFRPVTLDDVAQASKLTGGRGLRTLKHHAEVDVAHARELAAVIDGYATEHIIAYNAVMTHNLHSTYSRQRVAEALKAEEIPWPIH